MSRYADVLPDPGRALSQVFTYRVPEPMRRAMRVGAQVLVPFGPRTVVGAVVALREETDRSELKDVEALLEDAASLPEDALPLATWIADYYLCELGEALRPFLPQGATYRVVREFRLTGDPVPADLRTHPDAGPVIRSLEAAEGEVSLAALRRAVPARRLSRAVQLLKSHGVLAEQATLRRPQVRLREVRLLEVAIGPEEVEEYCEARARQAPARVACLRVAVEAGPLGVRDLAQRAEVSATTVRGLVEEGLLRVRRAPLRRVPWRDAAGEQTTPPGLTAEQTTAVEEIARAVRAGAPVSFLLYGVTASGKTEVFLRVVEEVLAQRRQAIVLMPEISLTAQAVRIYRARFGERVALLHSGLSVGERWDEWQRIRNGEAEVVIGARSALFAPTSALGLIVVDEEHESSYKQEHAPRYHARDVALRRGELSGCPVVLASATPSLESFYAAQDGRHRLLRLPTRIEERPLPRVRVVDMRGSTRRPAVLSPALRRAIGARLQSDEQVILFLNRRGYSTFLLCPACGEAVRCPECRVALTYHHGAREVRCHHCGLAREAPTVCARCGGHQIRFSGFGTERVERELSVLFPTARTGRLDRDTTTTKGAHVSIVGQFRAAETNVLIGTQMVAKGFDFPQVTLVGVVSADTSLNLPDFRSAERTFQLLTQVSGRSGRGEKEGEVIIQTFRPDHYSIEAAAQQDYEAFYRRELEGRRELGYPPFSHLFNLTLSAEQEEEAADRAESLAAAIRREAGELDLAVLGPAPAPIAKLRGRYRWHVLVRGPHEEGQRVLRSVLAAVSGRGAATLSVDVDPVSLM